jgi:glycosyltransferase involved in cell wall biosynthesis
VRVLLLTHYYAPELGAPQTRLRETAASLRGLGHEVRVVTGPPHYPSGAVRPGYRSWWPSRELLDGTPILRLPMIPRRNGGLLDRSIDQGSFALAASVAAPLVRWSDVMLVESPPLFLGLTAAFAKLATRRPYVYHVADPWPDFPVALGMLRPRIARRIAYGIEALAYRHAALITTVTPGIVRLLDAKPSARGRVRLVPNGVDVRRFSPDLSAPTARATLGWPEARLTLVYAGSVGLAQGVMTLVEGVAPLASSGIVLHIVGEGYERPKVAAEIAARGLGHVRLEDPVEEGRIPTVLAAADVILVALRRGPLYEASLPTKLLEGLAAGRPVLISAAGDAATIVEEAGAGLTAPPEDAGALRERVRQLANESQRRDMGRRARHVAEASFDRGAIVRRLAGLLEEAQGR